MQLVMASAVAASPKPQLERTLSSTGSAAGKEQLRAAFSLFAVKDEKGEEYLGPEEFARLMRYPGLQTDQVRPPRFFCFVAFSRVSVRALCLMGSSERRSCVTGRILRVL